MIEGTGPHPDALVEENVRQEIEICHEAPFYTIGPHRHGHRAGLRPHHVGSAPDDRIGSGPAMLCYVTPKEHLGSRTRRRRQGRRHRVQDRGARRGPRAKGHPGARLCGTTRCRRRGSSSAGRTSFHLAARSRDRAGVPRRDAAGGGREARALLLACAARTSAR